VEQQSPEQGGEQFNTSPYASPMHQFSQGIILLTNPENDLFKLELTLRGLVEVRGKVAKGSEPLMNDEGVRSVLGQVQSIVNRITVLSKFDDGENTRLMRMFFDTLIKDLMLNRVHYEIKNASAPDRIFSECCLTAYECLKRGHEQGERNFWKGSQQEITTRNVGGGEKKGLLSRVLGWGGK
jgi:hypothetical protein